MCPKKTVENVLKGHVQDDEQVEDWAGMFHLLASSSGNSFENEMKKSIQDANRKVANCSKSQALFIHAGYFILEVI